MSVVDAVNSGSYVYLDAVKSGNFMIWNPAPFSAHLYGYARNYWNRSLKILIMKVWLRFDHFENLLEDTTCTVTLGRMTHLGYIQDRFYVYQFQGLAFSQFQYIHVSWNRS